MSPLVHQLVEQLKFVQSKQTDPDCASRVGWAVAEIQRLASQQSRALCALRYMAPRVQHDCVELSLRAAGTRVESDPVFQSMRVLQEDAMKLYNELEKEYATWSK